MAEEHRPVRSLPDLKALRESKGITIEAIAAQTKISRRYLRAIEENLFEELPAGVYAVSYLRQYARCIDIDEELLVDYYRALQGQGEDRQAGAVEEPASWWKQLAAISQRVFDLLSR